MQEQVGTDIPIVFSARRSTNCCDCCDLGISCSLVFFPELWQESDSAWDFYFPQQRFPVFPRQLEFFM